MIYAVTMCFIALDFLTGMTKAFYTKTFASSKMREGLWHKTGSLLVILLGVLVDRAELVLDLGFAFPVAAAACTYIVLMEVASVLENVCQINPELMPSALMGIFGVKGDKDDGRQDPVELPEESKQGRPEEMKKTSEM